MINNIQIVERNLSRGAIGSPWWTCAMMACLLLASSLRAGMKAEALRGELKIHEPSSIVKCDGTYWVFGTGRGIISRCSSNLVEWRNGPPVFTNAPEWTTNAVSGNNGKFWAPDIIHLDGRFLLYYSVSTWGSRDSAIGMASNRTLNPESPDYHWEDQGLVIRSHRSDDFNTIDPSVMQDPAGRLWLSFGSFGSGIKLVELDPKTGFRLSPNNPVHALAWKDAIEASCIYQHADAYYLFVNWGLCCRGTNSTYNIRVGRSANITGPYLDRDGVDMLKGGGSLFLGTSGDHIGPGHVGILQENGSNWLSYHYYNAQEQGTAMLDLRPLQWSANGWPEIQTTKTD
jgi:arabinan endo-1,5-alpha-L-arabinosidase